MTDSKTATERLRELLDERGVKYEADDYERYAYTYWGDWGFMEPLDAKRHTLGAQCELMLIPATPEQAIAASLGAEQPPVDKLIRCLENDYGVTASWDGLRKVWLTERAALGAGECRNVGFYVDSTRFKCSECGYNGWTTWAKDGEDRVPSYCPNCGAKVVGQ